MRSTSGRTELNVKLASLISLYDEYNPGPGLVRRKLIRARERNPGLASSARGTLIFELAPGSRAHLRVPCTNNIIQRGKAYVTRALPAKSFAENGLDLVEPV